MKVIVEKRAKHLHVLSSCFIPNGTVRLGRLYTVQGHLIKGVNKD